MRFKRFLSYVITILFVVSPLVVLWQRQRLYDWWSLRNYTPLASVEQLATDTTMTDRARTIFYVARPELKQKNDFRNSCESTEKTIVLGCYKSGAGIYVYDVTDERLEGVQQVTAAHEMLHAAYDRLSRKEKQRVDSLTSNAYAQLKDERIRKNVEAYRSRDASVVPNELHSILGSEVKQLSAELEQYYAQYFSDRSKIVSFSEQYESEFSKREEQVEAYDIQLKQLKTDIDALNQSLAEQAAVIDAESKKLDQLLAAKKVSEYNAGIPNYKRLITVYNGNVGVLKSKIESYNTIVAERNLVVETEKELYNAIDTRVPDAK